MGTELDNVTEFEELATAAGTEIIGLTSTFGAESVEGNFESYLAAVAVMDAVATYPGPFDAVIQAGFGEHGREGLQELLEVPVVDNGVNGLAVWSFVPTSVVTLTLYLVPAFSRIAPFGWFIGAALGAVAYYLIARGRLPILPAATPTRPGRPDQVKGTS